MRFMSFSLLLWVLVGNIFFFCCVCAVEFFVFRQAFWELTKRPVQNKPTVGGLRTRRLLAPSFTPSVRTPATCCPPILIYSSAMSIALMPRSSTRRGQRKGRVKGSEERTIFCSTAYTETTNKLRLDVARSRAMRLSPSPPASPNHRRLRT